MKKPIGIGLFSAISAINVHAKFLNTDELRQFHSAFEFVGNDPIQKVDRNGKGWEDAVSVNMGHYSLQIDFDELLHESEMITHANSLTMKIPLNQYKSRAVS